MNILIAQIVGYGSVAKSLMLEQLQRTIEDNPTANIYYLTCSNSYNLCYYNPDSTPHKCYLCKKGVENSLNLIEGRFKHLKINDITNSSDLKQAIHFSQNTNKIDYNLKFENFEVGRAVISSYISKTRDRDLDEISSHSFSFDFLKNSIHFYLGFKRFCAENEIDLIYNFNGRVLYNSAVMALAKSSGISIINVDIPRIGPAIEHFKNVLPHSIIKKQDHFNEAWTNSKYSEIEKEKIASGYFKKRRLGTKVNTTSFTSGQNKNSLPEGVDFKKRTVVLYTSSDDEFAALGDEFTNPHFKNQNDGIFYIAELFNKKFLNQNLIIRIHPNFSGVIYEYAKRLNELKGKYKNVFLIEPESKIDSYALLDVADKVITFGSSITTEATYWEKPVIMLGNSFFSGMEIAYEPKKIKELDNLLENDLPPMPKLGSLKFGYYLIKGGMPAKYYTRDNEGKTYFKGQNIFFFSLKQRVISKIIRYTYHFFGITIFVK